jgi:hypothetical protein
MKAIQVNVIDQESGNKLAEAKYKNYLRSETLGNSQVGSLTRNGIYGKEDD